MCDHHRHIEVGEIEPPTPDRVGGAGTPSVESRIVSMRFGTSRLLEPQSAMPKAPVPQSTEERPHPVVPTTHREPRTWSWSRPEAPSSHPIIPTGRAEFFHRTERKGTAPNPNKPPKYQRTVATRPDSSTLKPDGTVDVDKLLEYVHSVPAKGMGKRRRRRGW